MEEVIKNLSYLKIGFLMSLSSCVGYCIPSVGFFLSTRRIREIIIGTFLFAISRILFCLLLFVLGFYTKLLLSSYFSIISAHIYVFLGILIIILGIWTLVKAPTCPHKILPTKNISPYICIILIGGLIACGPVISVILSIIVRCENFFNGFLNSLSFSLGLVIVAVLIFLGILPLFSKFFYKIRHKIQLIMQKICGIIIIILGIRCLL